MTRITIAVGTLLLPSVAAAHPDHASGGSFGLVHFLTDPFHLGLTAGALLLFAVGRRFVLRRQSARSDGR